MSVSVKRFLSSVSVKSMDLRPSTSSFKPLLQQEYNKLLGCAASASLKFKSIPPEELQRVDRRPVYIHTALQQPIENIQFLNPTNVYFTS